MSNCSCPSCGVQINSKYAVKRNYKVVKVLPLKFCPCCGVRLRVVKNEYGWVDGYEVVE